MNIVNMGFVRLGADFSCDKSLESSGWPFGPLTVKGEFSTPAPVPRTAAVPTTAAVPRTAAEPRTAVAAIAALTPGVAFQATTV